MDLQADEREQEVSNSSGGSRDCDGSGEYWDDYDIKGICGYRRRRFPDISVTKSVCRCYFSCVGGRVEPRDSGFLPGVRRQDCPEDQTGTGKPVVSQQLVGISESPRG